MSRVPDHGQSQGQGQVSLEAALQGAQQAGLPRLEAQLLLLHALQRGPHERAWLLAHGDAALPAPAAQHLRDLIERRLSGEPLAYLTGQREFYGLRLQIDARVLDPRPDTETLVDWALELLPLGQAAPVLDLGTGSGAIALALQQQRPQAQVWALDASLDALAVARANAERLHLPLHLRHGHWLRGWPTAAGPAHPAAPDCAPASLGADHAPEPPPAWLGLIVSNPPYIRAADPHLPALRHEPQQALVAGPDGLDDLREIIASAYAHLLPSGWLLLEHGWDQADAVAALLHAHGYQNVAHRLDLAGHRRCSGGQRPAP
ncbi:peptide chain release factor N(5)-glutamine methyltransferase [Serpentinimonas maccroryi]|uniref:peptide chain release factor N(5)-glutamine methyltransferase n=1 Tax=Serpentinimonas maccroryi TaxID=1458426 RepID=UPI0020337974|nr:peptide chain release factor N(5)-glutamine methyltransferase [Serpentinimonas maccroryi]